MKNYRQFFNNIDYDTHLTNGLDKLIAKLGYVFLEEDVDLELGLAVDNEIESIVLNNCVIINKCSETDKWVLKSPTNEYYGISEITRNIFKNSIK